MVKPVGDENSKLCNETFSLKRIIPKSGGEGTVHSGKGLCGRENALAMRSGSVSTVGLSKL